MQTLTQPGALVAPGCSHLHRRLADDIIACGARGIISEPCTDCKATARRHKDRNLFLAGEGDNRVLMRNAPAGFQAMGESMAATAAMTGRIS